MSIAALAALGRYYGYRRSVDAEARERDAALSRFGYAMALAVCLAYTCQASTYLMAITGRPFQTDLLRRVDAMAGFSWPVWKSWVSAHSIVQGLFAFVYGLYFPATAFTVGALALHTRDGAVRFLRAFAVAFSVSALGLLLLPSLTNDPHATSNAVRLALRSGTFQQLDMSATVGLIAMPSMHAALGVLVPAALWPAGRFRPLLCLYGIAMVVASISEGGHNLVDVLVGALMALIIARLVNFAALAPPFSHSKQPQT
jgi:membrane-associated phospholipid phosphatase